MGDGAKWLILGATLGYAVHWMVDWFTWRKWAMNQPGREELENAVRKVAEIESRFAGSLTDFETQMKTAAELVAAQSVQIAKESQAQQPVTDAGLTESGLASIESISNEHRSLLEATGILTLQDLIDAGEERILEAIGAQPWDAINVSEWIDSAKTLVGDGRDFVAEPIAEDLGELPGITPEQVNQLITAGLSTFAKVAECEEDRLLEAVGAQPWDMIDVAAWIAAAKEKSNG